MGAGPQLSLALPAPILLMALLSHRLPQALQWLSGPGEEQLLSLPCLGIPCLPCRGQATIPGFQC